MTDVYRIASTSLSIQKCNNNSFRNSISGYLINSEGTDTGVIGPRRKFRNETQELALSLHQKSFQYNLAAKVIVSPCKKFYGARASYIKN